MGTDPAAAPAPEDCAKFAAALDNNHQELIQQMLANNRLLANADLRPAAEQDGFTNGFPLFRACDKGLFEIAESLLQQGAHPDAPSTRPDPAEIGMPLHRAVALRDYKLANLLLDHGATPNGYPDCSQATIERAYYHAREAGVSTNVIRRAYAKFLPDRAVLEKRTTMEIVVSELGDDSATDASKPILLFARMVDAGGQPPFTALVREGFDDLLMEIVEHSADDDGTPHDYPPATVFNAVFGAARWFGYPKLVRRLMEFAPEKFNAGGALTTIDVAIGSHNRDGEFADYRTIIVDQLEYLRSIGKLDAIAAAAEFNPIFKMATDFCWHSNYGYRAEIVKPECYVELAELFVSYGFCDINFRDPESNHSPLSAAVKRGKHPGIATYIQWLLENGADLREAEDDPTVNPLVLARENGLDNILQILSRYQAD